MIDFYANIDYILLPVMLLLLHSEFSRSPIIKIKVKTLNKCWIVISAIMIAVILNNLAS